MRDEDVARMDTTGDASDSRTASAVAPTAHTPGPWRWSGGYLMQDCPSRDESDQKESNPYSTPAGRPIADDGSAGGEYTATIDTNGPDARLISAAPDLLAALKLFMTCYPSAIVAFPDEQRDSIYAAIAKAEGTGTR